MTDTESYSLEQKIGQMVMIGFRGTEIDEQSTIVRDIKQYHLGGVWLTDNESPMGHTLGNVRSSDQLKRLTGDLQNYASIPLFMTIDGEGGQVIRLKEKYGFPPTPTALQIGMTKDFEYARQQARKIAEMIRQCGVNFNFAPVVDVLLNRDNPALAKKERSFSDNVDEVIAFARIVAQENHRAGLFTAIKHFPGQGSAGLDSHVYFVDVSDTWSMQELRPFSALIEEHLCDAVLTAHIKLDRYDQNYPATLSNAMVNGLLRRQLGFDGLVISDDLNMKAISDHYPLEEAIRLSVQAGVDILLHSNVDLYDADILIKTVDVLQKLVRDGIISRKRIDLSFRRILSLKRNLMGMGR